MPSSTSRYLLEGTGTLDGFRIKLLASASCSPIKYSFQIFALLLYHESTFSSWQKQCISFPGKAFNPCCFLLWLPQNYIQLHGTWVYNNQVAYFCILEYLPPKSPYIATYTLLLSYRFHFELQPKGKISGRAALLYNSQCVASCFLTE